MASKVTQSQLAEHLGVTPSAISKAIAAGRLTVDADGLLDPVAATAQWQHNRRRRQRMPRQPAGEPDRPAPPGAGDFWQHRTTREAAEAAMARMREREMAGELVRRAEVERELAGKLVALRVSLETLADRVAALVAAEPDIQAIRRIIADEHRQALAAFAERLEGADGAGLQ